MRVLAIGAHPDDIEIGCGGTIAKLLSEGAKVSYCIVTDGRSGHFNTSIEKLIKVRKSEARSSANSLGVKEIHFLELDDAFTSISRENKISMIRLIRSIKPDIIFTHSTTDHFSDHMLVNKLTIDSCSVAGGPWFQEVKIEPYSPKYIYGYEVWNPINSFQLVVDITETVGQKLKALSFHESQLESINYLKAVEGLNSYRGVMSGNGGYAEVFEVIKSNSLH